MEYLISPGAAYAEWDSSNSFGDSYYLREIAENIDDVSDELSEISGAFANIESDALSLSLQISPEFCGFPQEPQTSG